jgi:hypothetical protein
LAKAKAKQPQKRAPEREPKVEKALDALQVGNEIKRKAQLFSRHLKSPEARERWQDLLLALIRLNETDDGLVVLRLHGPVREEWAFELAAPHEWKDGVDELVGREREKGEKNRLLLDIAVDVERLENGLCAARSVEELALLSNMRVRGHSRVIGSLARLINPRVFPRRGELLP